MPSKRHDSLDRRIPRLTLRTRAALIIAAAVVQTLVVGLGWFVTFRIVQREFAGQAQELLIDQTSEYAETIASLFREDDATMAEFGSEKWESLQRVIEGPALQSLPHGAFACLIEEDGQLLCHPEIRENQGLRNFSFDGMTIRDRIDVAEASFSTDIVDAGLETGETVSGV
ncbi:MAG: hypothetical protein AAF747_03655, partial [Planctomycetota bacterium]